MKRLLRISVVAFVIAFALTLTMAQARADDDGDGWTAKFLKGLGDWKNIVAEDINKKGKIVGYRDTEFDASPQTEYRLDALCWKNRNASPKVLDPLTDHTMGWAGSVNKKGVVGGFSAYWRLLGGRYRLWRTAVLWDSDGKPKSMFPSTQPNALNTEIWGLNDSSDAVGAIGIAGFWQAFRWWADGTEELLEKSDDDPSDDGLEAYGSRCHAINNDGTACGVEFERKWNDPGDTPPWVFSEQRAVLWTSGGDIVNLHEKLQAAESGIQSSVAQTINKYGEVAGVAWDTVISGASTKGWAWVWSKKNGVTFLVDQDEIERAAPRGSGGKHLAGIVNGDGWVIGDAEAAVWTRNEDDDEVSYSLDTIPTPFGYSYSVASSVNKKRNVVGYAVNEDGDFHAWVAWGDDDDD
jgi:hypothetical protein